MCFGLNGFASIRPAEATLHEALAPMRAAGRVGSGFPGQTGAFAKAIVQGAYQGGCRRSLQAGTAARKGDRLKPRFRCVQLWINAINWTSAREGFAQ